MTDLEPAKLHDALDGFDRTAFVQRYTELVGFEERVCDPLFRIETFEQTPALNGVVESVENLHLDTAVDGVAPLEKTLTRLLTEGKSLSDIYMMGFATCLITLSDYADAEKYSQ